MVPFIDVMLVLLIIFMVTAPLITPSLIDLPSVGKAAKQPDQVIEVVVGKDERLELKNGDKTDRDEPQGHRSRGAAGAVRASGRQRRRGDQRRPQREVRDRGEGHGHLQRAGVQRVGLSVQISP